MVCASVRERERKRKRDGAREEELQHGGSERPLGEAVNVKPGLHCRFPDVGNPRVMRHQPRRPENR